MIAQNVPSQIADIQDLGSRLMGYRPQQGGYYVPRFYSTSQLESLSGTWAVDGSGGIRATTPGSQVSGMIRLPVMIDVEKPFRVDYYFQYKRALNRGMQLGLGDPYSFNYILNNANNSIICGSLITAATQANPCVITTANVHGLATGDSVTISGATGMTAINGTFTVTRVSATTFSIAVNTSAASAYGGSGYVDIGSLGINNLYGLIADGEMCCVSFAGMNGVVTISGHVLGTNPQSYSVYNPWKTCQYANVLSSAVVNSRPVGAKLDRLYFNNMGMPLWGIWVNPNGWDGPPDSRMPTRTVIYSHRLYDQQYPDATLIMLPSRAKRDIPQETVVFWHQNLGDEQSASNANGSAAGLDQSGLTCRTLLDNGYAWIASSGTGIGSVFTNGTNPGSRGKWHFGNGEGVSCVKRLLEDVQANVTNVARKTFHFPVSMGGAGALNFIRNYPGLTKGVYGVHIVTDLNESGLTGAPASLSTALNAAYSTYWVCINGHTNSSPADGTNWRPIAGPGADVDLRDRLPNFTTVTSGASSATQALGTTVGMLPGQKLYFRILREWRTIVTVDSSTQVTLDQSISTTTNEPVCVMCNGRSAQWNSRAAWNSGTAYVIGDIAMLAASAAADFYSQNPVRTPEIYVGIPIKLRYGNSGGTSDGTLNTVQTTAFASAVNAITNGNVTAVLDSGVAHLGDGGFNAADQLTFYNANKGNN